MSEKYNPFCGEELSNLCDARERGDLEFLKSWSKEAVKAYEAEANKNRNDAIKWRRLLEKLSEFLEPKDFARIKYGEDCVESRYSVTMFVRRNRKSNCHILYATSFRPRGTIKESSSRR